MNTKTLTPLFALLCCVALASSAAAQSNPNWRGQENEFGKIQAPFAVDMTGQPVEVQAEVVLLNHYEEKDGRFFMFMWDVERTNLEVEFTSIVRTDTGAEIECFKTEGSRTTQMKCTIDRMKLPAEGVPIMMKGIVKASRTGSYTLGALVVPFTATWLKVTMTNGFEAELYAGTLVNVKTATHGTNAIGGFGNKVPGIGAVGLVAAGVIAVGVATLRRRG